MDKFQEENKNRREFLKTSLLAGSLLPFWNPFLPEFCRTSKEGLVPAALNILILGGTSFLGPHQIAYALERGHSISIFTRGKTKPTIHKKLYDEVEWLIGDREDNLEALKNRKWDAVIDNSGRKVKWTEDTAQLLKDNAEQYLYVSSVSVFYPYYKIGAEESDTLVLEMPADLEEGEKPLYDYGIMKARSSFAASRIFGIERTITVRPTFMTGPADRTDRFMYWPVQIAKGGDVIVPGKVDDQVQFIDVRDMAEFMIRLLENKASGTYSGVGPKDFMNLDTYVDSGAQAFGQPVNKIAIDDTDFLTENNLSFMAPWVMPSEKIAGICRVNNNKALKAGLTFRPLEKTFKDTYDWWYSDAVTADRREKFESDTMPRISNILANWANKK